MLIGGAIGWSALKNATPTPGGEKEKNNGTSADGASDTITAEVVVPSKGGIEYVCTQPGTIEAFETVDLYAYVSGFLAEQSVDLGTRVKKGQVIARIAVPEHEKDVLKSEAQIDHMKARVKQMESKIVAVEAEARAAKSAIALSEALVAAKSSFRSYRKKQLDRVKDLLTQNAVDARLVDESEDQFESAFSSEVAAKEAVTSAKLQSDSAQAKVIQAKADLDEAKAQVRVAEAELARAKVMVAYSIITAPYDGVITRRNYFPGASIRAAVGGGGQLPLFTVEKTDQMRVIIQVPDRYVRYLNVGDPAKVEIDALPKEKFEGVVARISEAEDPGTRSMHAEVDIPNPKGALRRGMYGKATLVLEPGAVNAVTVPTSALEGKVGDGHASARVVRGGKAYLVPVRVGVDNGINVEVLEGLQADDTVIVRFSSPPNDGDAVQVVNATAKR